jgi:RNA polymerase sigma-70 factor (ECF subfamily)
LEEISRDAAIELFSRIAAGDEEAYRLVFHYYNARLFYSVLKLVKSNTEAEEIIQETFLRLWLRRATLPGIENPPAWLFTVSSNLALDTLRKQAKERQLLKGVGSLQKEVQPDSGFSLEAKDIQLLLRQAINQLPPSRRMVFEMSRNEGLNRRDIAEKLHISENTVKNQLTSALHFIRDYIEKAGSVSLPATLFFLFLIFLYRG